MPRTLLTSVMIAAIISGGCTTAPRVSQSADEPHPLGSPLPASSAAASPALAARVAGAFPKVTAEARWPSYPSLASLAQAADLIVRGEVTAVLPGRSIAGPASLPFTNATIAVTSVAKGAATSGASITVEQTGGFYISSTVLELQRLPQATPPPGAGPGVGPYPRPSPGSEYVFVEVGGDPLFFMREEVVLFLRWKPELGVYQIVGPQGRFRVLGENMQAMAPRDGVVGRFHGAEVSDLFQEIATK